MTTRYVSRVAMFVLVVKILSLFVSVHITLSMWSSADATLTSINSTKRILFFCLTNAYRVFSFILKSKLHC